MYDVRSFTFINQFLALTCRHHVLFQQDFISYFESWSSSPNAMPVLSFCLTLYLIKVCTIRHNLNSGCKFTKILMNRLR